VAFAVAWWWPLVLRCCTVGRIIASTITTSPSFAITYNTTP
jgi:hypothetical protein